MVSVIVRFTFNPEDRAEIAEALRLLAVASRLESGCANFIPHHAEGDPDTVILYEQYQDAQAQADHRKSEHFKKYVVECLFQKMKERTIENLVALV